MRRSFVILAALVVIPFASGNAQANDTTRAEPYDRSELAATALAYLGPGLGHFYAGDNTRGAFILGAGSLAIIGVGWMMVDGMSAVACDRDRAPGCINRARAHLTTQGAMMGIGIAAWLWGLYDAPRAVQRQRKLDSAARAAGRDVGLIVAPGTGSSETLIGLRFTP